ncbi:MAG: hypothetical protein MR802_14005 [Prevotella sp.]|nr:hypothetical protein [Prevotella sp.]
MNRINHYVLNGAIALLSTAGLVACSSSDDVTDAPVNPSYDGKSVKTQFAINIATPVTGNPSTRMSDVNTQNGTSRTNSFLGMYNIKLIPSAVGPTVTVANPSYSVATDVAISKIISLKDLASSEIASDKSSKIYTDVNIPVGTQNFIFYGTGPFGTDISSKLTKGILTLTEDANVGNTNDIKFKLNTIIDGNNSIDDAKTSFIAYLNAIANTTAEISGTTKAWSSVTKDENPTLHGAYTNFTGIGSTVARAGSADAILKTVEQLYNLLSSIPDTDPYYLLVSAIRSAITDGGSSGITLRALTTDPNNVKLEYTMTDTQLKNFPRENGLPDGAMQLSFDNNNFSYKSSANVGTTTTTSNLVFDVTKLTYPAALAYFVNTPARATTAEISSSGTDAWPTTVTAWDEAWASSGKYSSWTTTVNSNSRTVALQYNINYGVACLETTFQCKSGLTELEDNAGAFGSSTGTKNNSITIPSNGFKVTGIIIGGQTQSVNWDFLNPTTDRAYAVYDRYMAGKDGMNDFIYAKAGTQSDANYTLVFDNYVNPQSPSTPQEAVNIAIELENNSNAEFYGVDGKIAKGQKFYLVAKLDPNDNQDGGTASGTITWPEATKSNFPAREVNRVFIQDYTTKAKFTINSLKNAYVTIPDLRASKLQLGLSVDLQWRTGLTFDVTIE